MRKTRAELNAASRAAKEGLLWGGGQVLDCGGGFWGLNGVPKTPALDPEPQSQGPGGGASGRY